MESETLEICERSSVKKSSSSSSSWPIFRGALDDVVTCESSISADVDDADQTARRKPVIMRRDSGPCEITILFTQLHEIKQVYIRSTAKVFEIYCATNEKSDGEYLCTVRCGLAARDEELQLTDGVISTSDSSSGSNRSMDEGRSKSGSESSSNEDGWVDVKLNKASSIDSGDNSLLKKEASCLVQDIQDCYEATAEISDGDPVLSITLRLLSIQSGDHVYIDEVYVFADPVESANNHSSAPSLDTSSGGAMLSMFIPTLMQLSKSKMSQVKKDSGSAAGERKMNQDTEQHSTGAVITSNVVQTEVFPSTMHNGASVHQPNHMLQTPNPQNRPHLTYTEDGLPCSRMEQTLDKLASRVSKIEEFCLRFEESMLKPIISMEARLERVEHQLESLIKNPQLPRTGCTRFSAPEFSCNESESNSIGTVGIDCPINSTTESSKRDSDCLQELCIPTSDAYEQSSAIVSQRLPGLIISAPDFSYIDEEEEINSTVSVKDSPKTSKKRMSVDSALASALAGFLTSALTKPSECTVKVEEDEIFSSADSGGTSPPALSMTLTKHVQCIEKVEEPENVSVIEGIGNTMVSALVHSDEHLLSSVPIHGCNTSSEKTMVAEEDSLAVVSGAEETTEAVDGNNHYYSEEGIRMLSLDCGSVDSLHETGIRVSNAGTGCTESDDDGDQTFVTDLYDSPTIVDDGLSKDVYVAPVVVVPGGNTDYSSGEGISSERHGVLQDIIESPGPAIVDFSVPVLDVKFSSLGNSSAKSLESLLVDMPDLGCEVLCVSEDHASPFNEHYDLVVIENEEPGDPEIDDNQLLYVGDYSSVYMPSGTEMQDSSNCSSDDMYASLI